MTIDIIFDLACPWCYIGRRQLDRAFEMRPNIAAKVRWWPFLLHPEVPPEGLDRTTYLIRKFGSEARVGRIFGAIAHVGQSVQIEFAFNRIRRTPNTTNAHKLVYFASRVDRASEAVEAVFHNHFVKGKDVGDLDVLTGIGGELGFDERNLHRYLRSEEDVATIQAENARAHRLGINGVPAFVFNQQLVICGAQEPMVLAHMLDAARESVRVAQPVS